MITNKEMLKNANVKEMETTVKQGLKIVRKSYQGFLTATNEFEYILNKTYDFKLHEVAYELDTFESMYKIDQETMLDLFDTFCMDERDKLESYYKEVTGEKMESCLEYIGRSSSFHIRSQYLHGIPCNDLDNTFLELLSQYYMFDPYIIDCNHGKVKIVKDYSGLTINDMESIILELLEWFKLPQTTQEWIETLKNECFKKELFLYEYLRDFKKNQVRLFESHIINHLEVMETLDQSFTDLDKLHVIQSFESLETKSLIDNIWETLNQETKEKLVNEYVEY